ncbi:MAG: hypothetical protein LBC61_00440 [Candidatus Peribacteria bacterium]|jgi:hypothetical protein|nr:hypothetical protein [Candidatus Peribacteria bacterium]
MIKRIESLEQDEKRSVLNLNSGKVGIFALVLSLTLACNDILAQSNNVS